MAKKITKLEFYKRAKKHFSKNKVGRVEAGYFPDALCEFINKFWHDDSISETNYNVIKKDIKEAKNKSWAKKPLDDYHAYNSAYFTSDYARMNFINSQIKKLDKK